MRNGYLWVNLVFEREVIFYEFDFETSDLEFEVSKSSIWEHTTSCDNGVFSFIIISQLRRPIELKFSQVCYVMPLLRYTKWEYWSLTITNIKNTALSLSFPYRYVCVWLVWFLAAALSVMCRLDFGRLDSSKFSIGSVFSNRRFPNCRPEATCSCL